MCAMYRERKPVDENGYNAETKPRGFLADVEFQLSAMWDMIGGLQTGRAWILR